MSKSSVDRAQEVAMNLWSSLDLSSGSPSGIRFREGTLRAANDVLGEVRPLKGSSLSPSGFPMDIYAPSTWHAACTLLTLYIASRASRERFGPTEQNFDEFFGNRPAYRGQARPRNIIPSGWRGRDRDKQEKWRQVFHDNLLSFMTEEDAVELDLFGRPQSLEETEILAQHYGLPTNLIDFTFDPMAALYFACGHSEGPAPKGDDLAPPDCAVVYFISVAKLCAVGKPRLTFPPVQARRLFLQAGFVADYGTPPEETPSTLDFEESWMWVQQNCARVFFPRTYPDTPELELLSKPGFLEPQPFFEESVELIKGMEDSELLQEPMRAVELLHSKLSSRPPWRVKKLDGSFIYTSAEFATLASYLEHYIRRAALLEMKDGPCLDPFVLGKLFDFDHRGFYAIDEIYRLPHGTGESLNSIRTMIRQSLECLQTYKSRH